MNRAGHVLSEVVVSGSGRRADESPQAVWEAWRLLLVVVLGPLMALGPLTVDMYLPAFPSISSGLRASEPEVQLTLTAMLVGFGLGHFLFGPLSDAVAVR